KDLSRKIFSNIKHGYFGDPNTTDGLYRIGTKVYFVSDDSGDGCIICAAQDPPGNYRDLKDEGVIETIEFIDDIPSDKPSLTPGDWFISKLNAWMFLAYSGLIWFRSTFGLEFIMNPILRMIQMSAER